MTRPQELSRAEALRLLGYAAGGSVLAAILAGVCAKIVAPLGGEGMLAALVSAVILLLVVSSLIGVMVFMYALYAVIRGPAGGTRRDPE